MTINNKDAYFASLWDWGFLNGCFGTTKIKPSDMDGYVERNGRFIWIETKLPGVEIPEGQRITFSNLVKRGDTVLVVWGKPNETEKILLMTPHIEKEYEDADNDLFRDIVGKWFSWANTTPIPKFGGES